MRLVILSYLTTSFLPLRLMTWMSSSSSETRDWSRCSDAGLRCSVLSRGRVWGVWVRSFGVMCFWCVARTAAATWPRARASSGRRAAAARFSESRRVRQRVCWCVRAVLRGPRGREAWAWAAAAGELGRAAAWRSHALGQCTFKPSPLLAETAR